MKFLNNLNIKKYFESEDIKNCKDLLEDIQNKHRDNVYTNLDLIIKSDLYNNQSQKDNLYNDLEFFIDYKNKDKTIFNSIDYTYTDGGSLFLENLILNPHHNINYLNKKKASFISLFNNIQNNLNSLHHNFNVLKENEKSIYWLLEDDSQDVQSLIGLLYFNGFLINKLNNSNILLTIKNNYKIFVSPVIGLVSPLLYLLTPFIMLRFKLKIKMSFFTYVRFVYNYYINSGFGNMLGSKFDILRKIWMGMSLLFYVNGIFNTIEISKLSYKLNNMICKEIIGVIRYLKSNNEIISKMYNSEDINNIYNLNKTKEYFINDTYLQKLININDNENIYLTNFGDKLNVYKYIKKDLVKEVVNCGYICDSIFSIYNLKNKHNLSFPNYITNNEPSINIQGLQHPSINNMIKNDIKLDNNRNLIITGPNAGGKSTFIKSIAVNILLTQTLCLGFCDKIELTPFYYISSQMNIVDDKGSESLFEAEMNRIINNVNIVKYCKDNNKKSILFLDELFNSTNVIEGICGSYSICKKLSESRKNITLLTTHYTYLSKLEKTGKYKNYKMNAKVNKDNIEFPYKICEGFSKQYVALELLKKNKLLKDNQDIFNEAIKFKKKLIE